MNNLVLVPRGTFGDKNDSLQFRGINEIIDMIRLNVIQINQYNFYSRFKPLNLFIQGDSSGWIMIEHWSDNPDLFFEFCEFIANKTSLELKIGIENI